MRGRALARLLGGAGRNLGQFGRLDLVGLGQHQPVADSGLVEHFHDLAVDILDAVPRIDQHQRALQFLPSAQEVVHQEAPLLDHILRRLGEAIAGHVDEPEGEGGAHVEEVEFLRPPRRVRRAGERIATGQRVEQRGLAHIGPPRERDFGHAGIGNELERRRGFQEGDRAGEDLPRGLDRFGGEGIRHAPTLPPPLSSPDAAHRAGAAGGW